MEFFADTANIARIRELKEWLPLSGVTTNPTIVARERRELFPLLEELLATVSGTVHVQTLAREAAEIVAEAERLVAVEPTRIRPKIPCTKAGLSAVMQLSQKGIRATVTGVVTVAQGLFAAQAGAAFVAPYINWVDNLEASGVELAAELVSAYRQYGLDTRVIAASVKTAAQLRGLIAAGAHAVTMPPETYAAVLEHPLTEKAVQAFEENWRVVFAEYSLDAKLREDRL